jgi:ribulose-phosphate 3-epimerase
MVTDPEMYFAAFAAAGANHVSFHIEVVAELPEVERLIGKARALGLCAGLVINPPTPVERILPFVHLPDLVLVMSVNPGFSGQAFIPSVLEKARTIRGKLRSSQRLQIDGGVGPRNAAEVRAAGCDVLVAGSALFGMPRDRRGEVIAAMAGR